MEKGNETVNFCSAISAQKTKQTDKTEANKVIH